MIGVGRTIVPYSPPKSYKGAPIYIEGRFILCANFDFCSYDRNSPIR